MRRVLLANSLEVLIAIAAFGSGIGFQFSPQPGLSIVVGFGLYISHVWALVSIVAGITTLLGIFTQRLRLEAGGLVLIVASAFLNIMSIIINRGLYTVTSISVSIAGIFGIGVLAYVRLRGGVTVIVYPEHGERVLKG